MAKKLTDFLKQLATKAGMSEDPALLALVGNEQIGAIEIPDEFFTGVDNKLLSLNSALDNHPDIKNKYTALALSPMDSKINTFIDSLSDLDDEGRTTLKAEKSTYKRFDNLAAKIKELELKKAGSNNDQDKTKLQQKIDKLHGELQTAKSEIDKIKADSAKQVEDYKMDYRLRAILGNAKTTMDHLPADDKIDFLLQQFNKHLQANGLSMRFDEKGEPQPYNSDGSKAYGANHTLMTTPALIDTLLAQKKLIPVTNTANSNGQQNSNNNGQGQGSNNTIIDTRQNNNGSDPNKISGTNQAIANMNLETLKLFETAPTN